MHKNIILVLALLVAALAVSTSAQVRTVDDLGQMFLKQPTAEDPGVPDTVRVETMSVPSGQETFTVGVYLYNDEELAGMQVPLGWSSSDFTVDSVSFVGGRLEDYVIKPVGIDNANQRIIAGFAVLTEIYLQPGSGLAFTLYMRAAPGTADQIMTVDSAFYPPAGTLNLALISALTFVPQMAPGTVTYGNPPTNPTISLDPTSFSFDATQDGANPPSQSLTISNTGAGTLNWTASKKMTWLTLNPTSGTGDATVAVSVDITGLTAGTYYDTITVSDPAATNDPQIAPVTLVVAEPPPTISLSPTSFSYTITQGDVLPNDHLFITNTGGSILYWTAVKQSSWLTLNPASGVGDADVSLIFSVAALTPGTYHDTITVAAVGATNTPQKAPVTLVVEAPPPHIVLAPTSFSYTITEGDNLGNDQLGVANGGGGTLNWTASNLTAWLSIAPTSGVDAGVIMLTFDVSGLAAGTYYDTITVADPAADNTPQKAPVTLVVQAPPPTIAVDPTSFSYAITEGGNIADAQLTITNTGGSVLSWTVSNLSDWLTLDLAGGLGDGVVTLSFSVSGLAAGDYYDTITVSDPAATNNPVKVPVAVTISAVPVPIIGVSPASFTFAADAGGANPPSQDLTITNIGEGTLEWTVTKSADWLSLDPTSGSGDGAVTVSVDISGLSAAVYYDTIQVIDPSAGNSPKAVPVMLTVTAKPMIVLDPTNIELSTTIGVAPPAQTIVVYNGGGGELNWTAANATGWLMIDPTSGGPGDSLITLTFDVTGLTEGIYYDTVTVSDPNADNSPQKTAVSLTIQAAPPEISLDPTLIELTAVEGDAIPDEQIIVTNTGGGTLNWTATNKSGWISLDPTSGSGEGVIAVSFDITGMGPGSYIDTISVSDPAASNSPQACVVELTVTEAPPDADTVYVETVGAIPGQQVMVGVNYVNFTTTYQFVLPLSFDPSDVVCDSVSFVGTRIAIPDESYVIIDNDAGTILIQGVLIDGPILDAGSGLISKLFFTVDAGAAAQFVTIDTTANIPDGNFSFEDDTGPKKTEFFSGGIDISATPCFSFPTDTVTFDLNYGGIVPSISFPVTNTCGGILEWTVSVVDDWAIVTPSSGQQDDQVTFTVDTTGLGAGTYVTTATFESNGTGTPYVVVIVLHVVTSPQITVTPQILNLGYICQGETANGSFDITNSGGEALDWHADALDPVTLSAYSGTAPSTVSVDIATDGLDYGQHTFEISVMSDDASNSPQVVYAKLTVVNCGECSFDIAEVDGPQSHAVAVPVYAFGIQDAAGVQFNISYDAAIVVPDSVTSAYMAGPTIGFANGQVHYVWDDINNPITVPDGEPIITLWFTVIGEVGQVSCFNWSGTNEVADPEGIPIEGLSYCSGCLTVVEPYFDLYGNVVYYDLTRAVAGVTVDLTGDAATTGYTDDHGDYVVTHLLSGDYLLTPSRFEDDPGVSVADAVKIRRHIAFVEIFDSPYKLIAADVNLSGTVTISDVILIRRYLAELDVLPSGNWRFVDAAFPITMDNWISAPADIDATITNNDMTALDFVAARMGDVNNTWSFPKVAGPSNLPPTIELTIPDLTAAPSEDIVIPVVVSGFSGVAGVEIHITFDASKMSVDGITSVYLSDPTVNSVDGRVHLIWDDFENPVTLQDNDSLMLIHCHIMPDANGDIPLNFMATCELVDNIGDPYTIILNNGKLVLSPTDVDGTETGLPITFSLKQNYPNPFNPSTTVSYTVDHTMSLTFEVFNVSGQLVERRGLGRKSPGIYSFVYYAGNLPSGVYTYRITGDGVSLSKQMMLIK